MLGDLALQDKVHLAVTPPGAEGPEVAQVHPPTPEMPPHPPRHLRGGDLLQGVVARCGQARLVLTHRGGLRQIDAAGGDEREDRPLATRHQVGDEPAADGEAALLIGKGVALAPGGGFVDDDIIVRGERVGTVEPHVHRPRPHAQRFQFLAHGGTAKAREAVDFIRARKDECQAAPTKPRCAGDEYLLARDQFVERFHLPPSSGVYAPGCATLWPSEREDASRTEDDERQTTDDRRRTADGGCPLRAGGFGRPADSGQPRTQSAERMVTRTATHPVLRPTPDYGAISKRNRTGSPPGLSAAETEATAAPSGAP